MWQAPYSLDTSKHWREKHDTTITQTGPEELVRSYYF